MTARGRRPPGKSQPNIEPSPPHPDALPVTRVSTEFHLRGIDLLTRVMHDELADALIITTLVRDQMRSPRRKASGVRALSRQLDMPYETVRRRVQELVNGGQCTMKDDGVVVPTAVLRGRRVTTFLRKIYVNAVRLLVDLTRMGIATFASSSRRPVVSERLAREQAIIAVAATGLLLAGVRALRGFWGGDVMRGMVYTAIWTANVKHVTNSAPGADRGVLPDSQRIPVSILAISQSLRLPYETVRRHADAMVKEGICVRQGRRGMVIPATFIHRIPAGPIIGYRLVMDFLADLRKAGVKV